MKVLVAGGAGYIGSHTVVALIEAGQQPIIVDNFSNSSPEVLERLKTITKQDIPFYEANLCDKPALRKLFAETTPQAVIHFAGYKAVGESVDQPLQYYQNNLESTLALCEVMAEAGVTQLIFSSSATVYGDPDTVPITEEAPLRVTNPYGRTKLINEDILRDLAATGKWQITLLRYFNPVGAHPSGLIGEDPTGTPNNLLPYVAQVAIGRRPELHIFGNDYDTPDGTGVRDYLHVVDLAQGHVQALSKPPQPGNCTAYNLGTGQGHSVREMIQAFELASGKTIPYKVVTRRSGDIGTCYADASKARRELGWQANKSLEDMCQDTWRWQSQNPQGYSA